MLTKHTYSYRDDPDVPDFPDDKPIIFFDEICVLCSGFVGNVLRNDRHGTFRFSTTQSPIGQAVYRHFGLDPVNNRTFLLLDEGRAYHKGDAALATARHMWHPWPLARIFRLLPRSVRDGLYDLVAKCRYRIFGIKDVCMMPDKAHAGRFL